MHAKMYKLSTKTDREFDVDAVSEIPSLLPSSSFDKGKDVIELGMGSRIFDWSIKESGVQEDGVDENGKIYAKNEDKTHILGVASGSVDLVFSNWLFTHVPEDEMPKVVESMMKWLRPDGHVFIRETCLTEAQIEKRQRKEKNLPKDLTCRQPSEYTSAFQKTDITEGGRGYMFKLVKLKNLGVYVRSKLERRHEVCWLWKKVPWEAPDHTRQNEGSELQHIFGKRRVSPGHKDTIEFVKMLNLKPGDQVLDVGCGIGRDDLYMAEKFGAEVVGIDNSVDTLALEQSTGTVEFALANCTTVEYPHASFNVIYSRDTLLHIQDKSTLFKRFYKWLKPGGRVLISDCCRAPSTPLSGEFAKYIRQRGYDLHSVEAYGQMLRDAEFAVGTAKDRTDQFVKLDDFEQRRAEYIGRYTRDDVLDQIVREWESTLGRKNEQKWGLFVAHKPSLNILKSLSEISLSVPKKSYRDAVKSTPPNVSKTKSHW